MDDDVEGLGDRDVPSLLGELRAKVEGGPGAFSPATRGCRGPAHVRVNPSGPPAFSRCPADNRPVMRTGRGLYFSIRRPARMTAPAIRRVPGRNSRPIVRGRSDRITLPNCPTTKLKPATAKSSLRPDSAATEKAPLRNTDRSRTGSAVDEGRQGEADQADAADGEHGGGDDQSAVGTAPDRPSGSRRSGRY
ncbi:hypothetical protein ACGFY6_30475 [Streptomyces sp. NPDC048387]|uniref:hypothetical protein n=1 Tax=Streptomyces sp. NPDC048387 TaxID=3365542 RepID=UPI0037146953